MARPLRLHIPGMLYHVMSRGNAKQCIFADVTDHEFFLALLARALARYGARCAAYCLMWNHYHLALRVGRLPLSRILHHINSGYCQRFNRRHARVGHVLQGRYKAKLVEDGSAVRRVLAYIAANPVAAGYVRFPEDYVWSSYRAALDLVNPPEFLSLDEVWSAFGTSDPVVGRARLAEFVRAGVQEDGPDRLLSGSERWKRRLAPRLRPYHAEREHAFAERHAARPPLSELFAGCVRQPDVDQAAYRAFVEHAYTLAEIGAVVSRHPSVICRWIQRARRARDAVVPAPADTPAKNKI